MPYKLESHGLTDVGRKRSENQDQFLIAELSKSLTVSQSSLPIGDDQSVISGSQGQLFIVADGMGGHEGGRRASQLAVETMARYLLDIMPWFVSQANDSFFDADQEAVLKKALDYCQRRIEQEGLGHEELRQMGTTFTMGYVIWPRLHFLHVGDSRGYLSRQGQLFQLTHDQTVAERLAELGAISKQDIPKSAFSHALWSYIGVDGEAMSPEFGSLDLLVGDTLLFCTDGLTLHVSNEEIQQALQQPLQVESVCRNLVDQALDRGGRDNVTVVIARIHNSVDALKLSQEAAEEEPYDPHQDTAEYEVVSPDSPTAEMDGVSPSEEAF
ncbi:MAG: serine/threonine-protein phosphatase [Planctomycetaceae bacterium]|nr:serine/threonine-protein phosphatase [Planctomycetaceae bacterium]